MTEKIVVIYCHQGKLLCSNFLLNYTPSMPSKNFLYDKIEGM